MAVVVFCRAFQGSTEAFRVLRRFRSGVGVVNFLASLLSHCKKLASFRLFSLVTHEEFGQSFYKDTNFRSGLCTRFRSLGFRSRD